ncbi:MAG: hypothetical protein JKY68_04260, partial [Rhodospirillales bacterium]|nr:hypothetical protein [Rhodospirillales bacterium]
MSNSGRYRDGFREKSLKTVAAGARVGHDCPMTTGNPRTKSARAVALDLLQTVLHGK